MKKIINIFTTAVLIILVAFAGVMFVPKVLGFEPMVVLSGSMEPTYHVGSIIYVNKNASTENIEVNDPITFKLSDTTVVTHRVVEIKDGEFITKGDANENRDGGSVAPSNVIGVPVFTIPYIGYIANYVSSGTGLILLITAIAVMILLTFLPDLLGMDEEESEKEGNKDED